MQKSWFLILTAAPLIAYGELRTTMADSWESDEVSQKPIAQANRTAPLAAQKPAQSSSKDQQKPAGNPAMSPSQSNGGYKELNSDWGSFIVRGQYLYWTAVQEGLEFAFRGASNLSWGEAIGASGNFVANPGTTLQGKIYDVPQMWKSGFRVGLGYGFAERPWDLTLDWTWYKNTSKLGISNKHPTTSAFANVGVANTANYPLSHNPDALFQMFGAPIAGGEVTSAHANWHLTFNVLDLKLSRKMEFGKDFSFNPHFGLRGAWINQKFNATYRELLWNIAANSGVGAPGDNVRLGANQRLQSVTNLKQDFKGLGFRTGFDTKFRCGPHFSFFADGAMSLFLGQNTMTSSTSVSTLTLAGASTGSVISPYNAMDIRQQLSEIKTAFDTAVGISWDSSIWDDCCQMNLDLGYEYQLWQDMNKMAEHLVNGSAQYVQQNFAGTTSNNQLAAPTLVNRDGDLSLHGLRVGLGFRF
jgi:hypothetical protein